MFLKQMCFPRNLESRPVSTVDESLLTGKSDQSESINQSMRDRENLHCILERKEKM